MSISDLDPETMDNFLELLDELLREHGLARCQENCPLKDRVDDMRRLKIKIQK